MQPDRAEKGDSSSLSGFSSSSSSPSSSTAIIISGTGEKPIETDVQDIIGRFIKEKLRWSDAWRELDDLHLKGGEEIFNVSLDQIGGTEQEKVRVKFYFRSHIEFWISTITEHQGFSIISEDIDPQALWEKLVGQNERIAKICLGYVAEEMQKEVLEKLYPEYLKDYQTTLSFSLYYLRKKVFTEDSIPDKKLWEMYSHRCPEAAKMLLRIVKDMIEKSQTSTEISSSSSTSPGLGV